MKMCVRTMAHISYMALLIRRLFFALSIFHFLLTLSLFFYSLFYSFMSIITISLRM